MSTLIARLRSLGLAVAAGLALAVGGTAGAMAQEEFKQIELTDEIVTSFIAAQKDYEPLTKKLAEAGDEIDSGLTEELDAVAKKHGFDDFADFEDVGANVSLVLDGLDPETKEFTDPKKMIKKELEEIKADDSIPADEKKSIIADQEELLASVPELKYPGNVAVVKKHLDEIEALLPEEPATDDGEDT